MSDRSKVDPALAQMQTPYRTVHGAYYTDGGSVSVEIVDHRGQSQIFFVSAKINDPRPYSHVYLGGDPEQDPNIREARFPDATKRMLADILKASGTPGRENDISIAALTGSTYYSTRAVLRGLLGESP
ncbi:MAG TPA: hypothetical protein VLC46_07445 [Thermoanaerobaculia bacterium]|jgi:hypothetical protein|nr:hypothetical protein [Thermoanaerobaculia bacterium]